MTLFWRGLECSRPRSILSVKPLRLTLGSIACIGAILLSGCQTGGGGGIKWKSGAQTPESDAQLERRVQALAAFSTGILLTEREELEAAYEQFAKAAEKDPGNEPLATDMARHYLQRNQPDRALVVLQRTANQPGTSGIIHALLADTLLHAGKTNQAILSYEKSLQVTPNLLGAHQQLAAIHLELKQPDKALSVLRRTLSLTNDTPTFWLNVGDLFAWYLRVEASRKDQVRPDWRQALAKSESFKPKEPADLLRLGRSYMELGDNAKAEHYFQTLNDQMPQNSAVAASLAEVLIRDGRLKEARKQFELLSKANPASHFPWYFLGVIDLEEKETTRAQRMFERAIQLNPDFEPAHADLAVALLNQNDPSSALAALQRALGRFPTSFRLVYLTALTEGRLEHFDKSLTAFKKAEALAGDRAQELLDERFYFQVAAMLTKAGKEAVAEEYLEKSLAINPEYDEALNHLGYTWAEQGKNLKRALDMIQRAVAAEPENPAYLDSFGWVLFKLGRTKEALPPLKKAIQLMKEPDPALYDHLGDVLSALGKKSEAREAWTKSLSIEKSDVIQKKLDASK